CRKAKQADGSPFRLQTTGRKNRKHKTRTDQHSGHPCLRCIPTPAAKKRRKPSSTDAADRGYVIDDDQRQAETRQAKVKTRIEKGRQPKQIEPPDRIGEKLRNRECPRLPISE